MRSYRLSDNSVISLTGGLSLLSFFEYPLIVKYWKPLIRGILVVNNGVSQPALGEGGTPLGEGAGAMGVCFSGVLSDEVGEEAMHKW